MKVSVLQRSAISRYRGEFASLSAFLLSAAPTIEDVEQSDFRGEGELTKNGEKLCLTYREEESGIRCTLTLEDGTLTLMRGGATLNFMCGKRTTFTYATAYGRIPTEAYTERIELTKRGNAHLLSLTYTAVFSGIAQKNELRFKITAQ